MKILFLDIDGVLNSHRTFYVYGAGFLVPNLTPDYDPKLDPVAIDILKKVVEDHDFKIVLSSSWRIGASFKECKHFFEKVMYDLYGWGAFPIIDITPDLPGYGNTRGDEIDAWLSNQTINIDTKQYLKFDDFVILDDDSDMLFDQMPHFFQVDRHVGLSYDFINWCQDRYQ